MLCDARFGRASFQGLRVIRLKGRLHLQVHKAVAFVLAAAAVFHALAGLAFLGVIG
ncbi:hypothetical protein MX659_00225 [Coriobacteriia bacterium Es71-Z0120]|uniref:hypothetical protein n=1 Tax=Parvivirga hydrogeniphila TaxID=2939460 RepID=UPI002260FEF9|nr:hypothetical protein [Parvivirga hydrogeniphila]MCL4078041.1 hypothetical protein [Parvivirga hydrogeniphila]